MIFAGFSLVSRSFHDETHSSRSGCPWHASGDKTKRREDEMPAPNKAGGSGGDAEKKRTGRRRFKRRRGAARSGSPPVFHWWAARRHSRTPSSAY